MNVMPHPLTNTTGPIGHPETPVTTKIAVKFAPDSLSNIQVKCHAEKSTACGDGPKTLTLFQIAAQMDVVGRPRKARTARTNPIGASKDFATLRREVETQKAARNQTRTGKKNGTLNLNVSLVLRPEKDPAGSKKSGPQPELKIMEFSLAAPTASSVKIAADFTGWEKCPVDLSKSKNGVWSAAIPLPPGQYSYRFIVDGQWCVDPASMERTPNPPGAMESVVVVV